MGILDETRFVERLRFFDGQRLFASDLQAIEAFHSDMRRLHNMSLHQAGIGNGFAVTGERDGREIRIGPGYALDSLGREILLTREQVEPIPPVASEPDGRSVFFDLVVSFDGEPEVAETRAGICADRDVVRLREEPVLCFVRLVRDETDNLKAADAKLGQEILDGLRIVLARLEVLACRLRETISVAQRRSARPTLQPHLACGEEKIESDKFNQIGETTVFHLRKEKVSTASGGFATTPCYSVLLARERIDINEGNVLFFILDSPAQIEDATPTSFTVEAIVDFRDFRHPPGSGAEPGDLVIPPSADLLDDWTVVWMGVE